MNSIWKWLLPNTDAILVRGRAGLVIATCLLLTTADWLLVLTWLISGDLEGITAVASLCFSLIMAGVAALGRAGRVTLAIWLLVLLLLLLISANQASYGLGSPSAASYVLPVVLAACGLGLVAGLGVALCATLCLWLLALAAWVGWLQPLIPFDPSHLTFNAPILTVILCLVALIVGYWSRYLSNALKNAEGNNRSIF